MISSRFLIPRSFRRVAPAWLAVAALAFHGLIPLGCMPDFAHRAEQPFAMTICSGMDMQGMAMGGKENPPDGSAADKSKAGLRDHAPCPFSVNAIFASTGSAPSIITPAALFIAVIAFAAFAFVESRRFGNAAPRAPPLFS